MKKQQIGRFLQTRLGFFTLITLQFCLKTVFAYYVDFSLGATDPLQHFLMFFNPIGTTMLLLSIGLYIKRPKLSYAIMFTIYALNTLLLFSNVLYYRQFTDFLTLNTIMNASKVSAGLGKSTISLLQWYDIFLWLDVFAVTLSLARHWLKVDLRPFKPRFAFTTTSLAVFVFLFNLTLSEANRPQLLTRTFDRNYIVKYLGLDTFVFYDSMKTAQNNQIRSSADGTDINKVLNYVKTHQVDANPQYYGKAAGKNVIIIHLESFQQFLIDYKYDGQEVTPFLNSLYHDKNTLSFSNFFHEVGQGKTSDAENMLETGTFGLPEGSVFTSLGTDNTFQAAPAILQQTDQYTSAVFHGNVGSFWNRNHVYKNLGYDYFFDSSYFNASTSAKIGYGIKDKLLFAESIKYLEQLQQPFYTKFITVTNHMPFLLSDDDSDFVRPTTKDKAVNNYFATAHYLDQAVKEFFQYLDKSGLSKNTLVMIYGDHYGLSDKDNQSLAPLVGKDTSYWTAFDNTQMQRVPFMLHMDGLKGGIKKTYGGEIDVLPTLLHLLGINTSKYAFFGQDLLSSQHQQLVAFRNNNFVTNQYTVLGGSGAKGNVYDNQTGELLIDLTPEQTEILNEDQKKVDNALALSDSLNMKNLLRFYTPAGFTPVNPDNYSYLDQVNSLITTRQSLQKESTSLFSENGNKSTTNLYQTDAPEITDAKTEIDTLPESGSSSQSSQSSRATSSKRSSKTTNQSSRAKN